MSLLAPAPAPLIRPARSNDAQACARLLHDGWRRAFPRLRRNVTLALFHTETEGETVLVAETRRRIVGFASVHVPDSFLHHLYVAPAQHRRGVGSALLTAARALAAAPITLKTQTENTRARAFYARHDFTAVEYGDDGQGPWVRLRAPS